MQKVRFVVHRDDVDRLLTIVQRHGAVEFAETKLPDTTQPETNHVNAQLFPRVQHAIGFLQPYEAKRSLWRTLREGTQRELTEQEIAGKVADTDVVSSVVDDLERLQVEFAEGTERIRQLEEQQQLLRACVGLPVRLADFETRTTRTFLVQWAEAGRTRAAHENLHDTLFDAFADAEIPCGLTKVNETLVAVTVSKTALSATDLGTFVEELGAHILPTPAGSETPEVELTAAEEALAKAKGDVALLHDQAEHFAITHLGTLRVASEVLAWERDRYATLDSGAATAHTVVFDGWLNATKRAAIEGEIETTGLAVAIAELELADGEEPPVEIMNSPFVQPFEVVTRLYGMPGYKDLDPTLFLAGFFFLFFGLSLTDVGYGLTLMVVSAAILTLFKVSAQVRMFAKLLLFVGTATVLVGMLFGGYLGVSPDVLPEPLKAIQQFDPIANPLPVFYLALSLGVFQIMVGLLLKIYSDARNGKLMDGILDQGPWLMLFTLGILYVCAMADIFTVLPNETLVNLVYVTLALIVVTSARTGRNVFEMVQKAAGSLYGSIGYFSDILSYSRLLALGLATTALAFAVNLIAEIVSGSVPYLGPILALAVLIIGHLFTLAVNTLGAFIHSARLQFVEFFGKFITGTGREFSPLSRTEKYVTIKRE
jgi:V/A-type H+-transporting ATPase subunit I